VKSEREQNEKTTCHSCGTKLTLINARYCHQCGSALSELDLNNER